MDIVGKVRKLLSVDHVLGVCMETHDIVLDPGDLLEAQKLVFQGDRMISKLVSVGGVRLLIES